MQEPDIVKIETDFVSNIVSRQIEKGLKAKKGYDVHIHIRKLFISNTAGKTCIHLIGNAETDTKELKKICGNSVFLKKILSVFLNNHFKMLNKLALGGLKTLCGFPIEINEKKYKEENGKSLIYIDAATEIKTEQLEKILERVCK